MYIFGLNEKCLVYCYTAMPYLCKRYFLSQWPKKKITTIQVELAWSKRSFKRVIKSRSFAESRRRSYYKKLNQQILNDRRFQFFKRNVFVRKTTRWKWPKYDSRHLRNWLIYNSWTYRKKCKLLHMCKILPSFKNLHLLSNVTNCPFKKDTVPRYNLIPWQLKCLSMSDIYILRQLNVHQGDFKCAANGYREKKQFH